MGISSIQRNVGASIGAGSKSLVGQYFRVANQEAKKSDVKSGPVQLTTGDDLKGQLFNIANKLKVFRESDNLLSQIRTDNSSQTPTPTPGSGETEGGSEAGGGTPPPPAPTEPDRINIEVSGDHKPKKFAKDIFKSFRNGVKEEDSDLLKNKRASGEVKFEIGEGDNQLNFSVAVDGNTSAREFVDEFNSKAQGRAEAKLVATTNSHGKTRYRIAIESKAPAADPQPPTEGESGGSGTPAPVTSSEFLGSGKYDIAALQEDSGAAAQDLKAFVGAFNKLVKFSKEGNKDGNTLSATGVDEAAIGAIRDALTKAQSKDGSVKFDSFVTERGNGELAFNENEFQRVFLEDSEGVQEALQGAADQIAGKDGVVRAFAGRGQAVDQAFASFQVQVAQTAIEEVKDRSITKLDEAQSRADRTDKIVTVLDEKTNFLSAIKR